MRFWQVSLCALLGSICAAAAGEIRPLQVPSPALGRDLAISLYVPALAAGQDRRLPVLYLLHGLGGSENDWAMFGNIRETMDSAIEAGIVPPMLVVMPGGGSSWYVNNPDPGGSGAMADALDGDLIPYVDTHFPTLSCRGGRIIGGVSMGGFGALLQAMDHKDLFTAAFGLSSALFAPMPDDEAEKAKRVTRMFRGVYGNPVDWNRFNGWNLFPRLDAYARDPDRTPIRLAVGSDDFANLRAMNRKLVDALAQNGVEVPFFIEPGSHEWRLWAEQLPQVLRWFAPKLATHC